MLACASNSMRIWRVRGAVFRLPMSVSDDSSDSAAFWFLAAVTSWLAARAIERDASSSFFCDSLFGSPLARVNATSRAVAPFTHRAAATRSSGVEFGSHATSTSWPVVSATDCADATRPLVQFGSLRYVAPSCCLMSFCATAADAISAAVASPIFIAAFMIGALMLLFSGTTMPLNIAAPEPRAWPSPPLPSPTCIGPPGAASLATDSWIASRAESSSCSASTSGPPP
mmetsp:Transcript_10767/g.44137  ORF Transcript_10767/g.44137 Transcript_10767/m.44137 type:complete len:228 (-) Transcript_10767:1476-2159(-)